jgi:hypothetical protein
VLPGKTGVLFESQTVDSLISAVDHFESVADTFDRTRIAAHAAAFSKTVFNAQMAETLGRWLDEHGRAQRRALPPLESVADKVAAAAA